MTFMEALYSQSKSLVQQTAKSVQNEERHRIFNHIISYTHETYESIPGSEERVLILCDCEDCDLLVQIAEEIRDGKY